MIVFAVLDSVMGPTRGMHPPIGVWRYAKYEEAGGAIGARANGINRLSARKG